MKTALARKIMASQDYSVDSVVPIEEGRNKHVFDVKLKDGRQVVAKFESKTVSKDRGVRQEHQFGAPLYFQREAFLYGLVREKAGLPAPSVEDLFETEAGCLMIVEKLKGKEWATFLKDNNYSLNLYLKSLESLGKDIAKAQEVTFDSYGSIMQGGRIFPEGIQTFLAWMSHNIETKLQRTIQSGALNSEMIQRTRDYFDYKMENLEDMLGQDDQEQSPVLVLADIHPMNFLIDDKGNVSGYPDLEFCQSSLPAAETYNINLQLLAFFDLPSFLRGKEAFYKGYHSENGVYDENDENNIFIEQLLTASHLFGGIGVYHGINDGLRDDWSRKFKDLWTELISQREYSSEEFSKFYFGHTDVLRKKLNQPETPLVDI